MPSLRAGRITTRAERDAWDDLATRSPVAHRHQCLWWMEPLERYGFHSSVVGCWKGDRLVGGALLRSYTVPLARTTITECLDGPIFRDWESAWADDFLAGMEQLAKQAGSMAVIIRDCSREDVHRDLLAALRRRGHTTALLPGSADAVLHLEGRGLDEIRKGFNHGTRSRIRKALAGPLQVRRLSAPEDLAKAYSAWIATANRRSFTDVRPWPGLEPVLLHCTANRLGTVLGTFLDDRLLAAAFVVHLGKSAAYVYGGYVDGAEKYSPTHVLQFEAIRESLAQDMATYNFGMLMSEGQQQAPRGVDDFKLGFGALPQRHLDTIVWKRRPLLYEVVEWIRHGWIGSKLEPLLKRSIIKRGAGG